MRNFILLLFLMAAGAGADLLAQGELSLYNMNRSLPQANELNPAFYSEQLVVVGLPAVSSIHMQYDGGPFSFDNMFTKNMDDTYDIDYDKISDKLNSRNTMSLNGDVSLFYLGMNLNRNHFSLGVRQKVISSFSFDEDVANLVIYGNGHEDLIGEKISFNQTTLNENAYFEFGLGYARDINDKLTVGLKCKYLLGFANVQLKDVDAYAMVGLDSIRLFHNGFDVYTAGENYFEEDGNVLDFMEDKNTGWSLDFGFNYQVNDQLSFSAAISDVGYINWEKGTKQYHFNPVDYNFTGFEIESVIEDDDSDDTFESELDSLSLLFTADELNDVSYKTELAANAYVGGNFEIAPGHDIGATVNMYLNEDDAKTSFGVYYNYHRGHLFNGVINVQCRDGYTGLGLGASLKLGMLQFYATTESLSSMLTPSKASFMDARLGINMVFGKVYR
jgi:hypothetical protein